MPQRVRKGPLNMELGEALAAELEAFCTARGEGKADVVRLAIRRHMANPPAQAAMPPLPPVTPAEVLPSPPKGRPRKPPPA